MPTTLPLHNGQHALMRDPEMVSQRQRRPFEKTKAHIGVLLGDNLDDEKLSEGEKATRLITRLIEADQYDLQDEFADNLVLMFVQDWSFEQPVNRDGLIDLPGNAYDALVEWSKGHLDKVFVNTDYDKTDEERTGPTGASAG